MSKAKKYNPSEIESKWQKKWQEDSVYKTSDDSGKENFYILDMFPYPSGEGLHVGHPKGYIATDIYSRMKRMQGYNVLHPMGFDAFGLPAEQYAIKNKLNPRVATEKNVANYKKQLEMLGLDYDWDREVNTTNPKFYKWTQWCFKQMYKAGLVSEVFEPINWCPSCMTGLANEDVENGACERCSTPVEKKPLRQWSIRITDYADRLLDDLDKLDWEPHIKELQRNWIGKSEGAEIDFEIKNFDQEKSLTVFTTRPDTLYGVTHLAVSAEKAQEWIEGGWKAGEDIKVFIENTILEEKNKVTDYKEIVEKKGIDSGIKAINPANGEEISLWIANYILAGYGTGAVMAVPAHDERDFEFAKKYNLPIRDVVRPYVVDHVNVPREDKETIVRENVHAIVRDPKTDKYLILRNAEHGWDTVVIGGIEKSEDPVEAALRELREETGYTNIKYIRTLGNPVQAGYFAKHKDQNRVAISTCVYFELIDDTRIPLAEDEGNEILWIDKKDFLPGKMINSELSIWLERLSKINDDTVVKYLPVGIDAFRPEHETLDREVVDVILENDKGQFLLIKETNNKGYEHYHFIGGGIEEGDSIIDTIKKEVVEESGYTDIDIDLAQIHGADVLGYRHTKNKNQHTVGFFYHCKLVSDKKIKSEVDEGCHEMVWVEREDVHKLINWDWHHDAWKKFINKNYFATTQKGILVNSGEFDGISFEEAKTKIVEKVGGRLKSQYKLRDWVFARQRYWGEPFPIVFDENRNHYAVADSELPVVLPDVENYEPTGTGESPLAGIENWVDVYGYINDNNEFVSLDKNDPVSKLFKRETNTMPQWAGSSWYYLRYIDPHNTKSFVSKEKEASWSGVINEDSEPEAVVDFYVGGAEHATRHLIYARFWHKFLYDQGFVSHDEPFKKLQTVGLIMAEDGRKMSKRWGNIVNPDDVVAQYGADTLRVYEMFMGPFEASVIWSTDNIIGSRRFLEVIWNDISGWKEKVWDHFPDKKNLEFVKSKHEILLNQTIKKVTEDIESFKFNTAISSLMIWLKKRPYMDSEYYDATTDSEINGDGFREFWTKQEVETILKLLAPFAPHMTEELWQMLGNKGSIHLEAWPKADPTKLESDSVTVSIQVNGKLRGTIECARDLPEEEVLTLAKSEQAVSKWLVQGEIVKCVYIKNKLVNFVVKAG
jgi:leucyl-tRNA synthetase